MIELFFSVVDAVWHFIFYLGEYVNHSLGKLVVGSIISLFFLVVGWTIFFQYFVKVFVYWGTIVYHQAHMHKKFDGTQEEFVKLKFRQKYPRTWSLVLLWSFVRRPLNLITWDKLDLVGQFTIKFYVFTFKIYRTENLKKFIANGWEIPVEENDA